jgi:hypothetical protein
MSTNDHAFRDDPLARVKRIEDECAHRGMQLKRTTAVERVGPCPVCGGRDRFSINIRKQVFNCRGCGKGGDVIELVRHVDCCGFTDALEQLTGEKIGGVRPDRVRLTKAKAEAAERRQHEKAHWFWLHRQPIKGTIAERYLRGRGITCPLPPTLAFLPTRKSEHHPAMIAAFSFAVEIEPGLLDAPRNVEAVHLTLLKPDGSGKADTDRQSCLLEVPETCRSCWHHRTNFLRSRSPKASKTG